MERHFDEELASLKNSLLEMCSLAEAMIAASVNALVRADSASFERLAEQERNLNQFQVDIDEVCCRLVALYQPTASDLRFLFAASRINNSIERLGDKAVSLSRIARTLLQYPPLKPYETIPQMVEIATRMVKESIHSFVRLDVEQARRVVSHDDVLDKLKNGVMAELIALMQQDREAVERGVRLILLAKNLERIGDLACNIAEDVIFMVQGDDIRHQEDSPF